MKCIVILFLLWYSLISCSSQDSSRVDEMMESVTKKEDKTDDTTDEKSVVVQRVSISGGEEKYNFSVTLLSLDKGCSQYADWWEVITEDGSALVYRRVLAHSHVNEQPFTRSGGLVKIRSNDVVIIRGHMNTLGYGNVALKGTVKDGFEAITLENDFASALATVEPLPKSCAF